MHWALLESKDGKSTHCYYKIFPNNNSPNNIFTMLSPLQNKPTFCFQCLLLQSSHKNVTAYNHPQQKKHLHFSFRLVLFVDLLLVCAFNYFVISFFDKFQFMLNGVVFWHFTRWLCLCVTDIQKWKVNVLIFEFQKAEWPGCKQLTFLQLSVLAKSLFVWWICHTNWPHHDYWKSSDRISVKIHHTAT